MQSLLYLILVLLRFDRHRTALLARTFLSLFLYLLFLPYVLIYNLYAGIVIKNPDLPHQQHALPCYHSIRPKIFLTLWVFLIFLCLFTLFLIGYALYLRFKHFRLISSQVPDMTWVHAHDFAWQVLFTDILTRMQMEEQEERESAERAYEQAMTKVQRGAYKKRNDDDEITLL
jgi:hypothetical protein